MRTKCMEMCLWSELFSNAVAVVSVRMITSNQSLNLPACISPEYLEIQPDSKTATWCYAIPQSSHRYLCIDTQKNTSRSTFKFSWVLGFQVGILEVAWCTSHVNFTQKPVLPEWWLLQSVKWGDCIFCDRSRSVNVNFMASSTVHVCGLKWIHIQHARHLLWTKNTA